MQGGTIRRASCSWDLEVDIVLQDPPGLTEIPAGIPVPGIQPRLTASLAKDCEEMARIRRLWHYQPGYDYQVGIHEYEIDYTSDPYYVVEDVSIMTPGRVHSLLLKEMEDALDILNGDVSNRHVSREVPIIGIPRELFNGQRNTGGLTPDLALWDIPIPPEDALSYRFSPARPPQLVIEVVSHSTPDTRDNDLRRKMKMYALLGVREYWILDRMEAFPLELYTLDGTGTSREYRRMDATEGGRLTSAVLSVDIRWASGHLETWDTQSEEWIEVRAIPDMILQARSRAEGQSEGLVQGQWTVIQELLEYRLGQSRWQKLQTAWAESNQPLPSREQIFAAAADPSKWLDLWPEDVKKGADLASEEGT